MFIIYFDSLKNMFNKFFYRCYNIYYNVDYIKKNEWGVIMKKIIVGWF